MAPRTPTDVNYAVLRRYLPRLHEILTIATYAHIYVWSSTSNSWSKAGFEGSLFLVSLNPPLPTPEDPIPKTEEYMLFLLNRYSLNNWHYKLRNPEDIDLESGEFCVLRANEPLKNENGAVANGNGNASGTEEEMAYGLFIFSEPGTSTAEDKEKFLKMTKECATTFQATSAAAAAPTPVPQQEPQQQQAQGRSISLVELFQQKDTQQPQESLQYQQPAQSSQQGYYTQSGWGYQDIGSGGQQMASQQPPPQHLPQQQWQQQWQSQPQVSYEHTVGAGTGASAMSGRGGDILSLFQNAKYRDSGGQNHGY